MAPDKWLGSQVISPVAIYSNFRWHRGGWKIHLNVYRLDLNDLRYNEITWEYCMYDTVDGRNPAPLWVGIVLQKTCFASSLMGSQCEIQSCVSNIYQSIF